MNPVIASLYIDNATPIGAVQEDLLLQDWNEQLRGSSAEQIVRWASGLFPCRLALLASMQKTSGVLMHMLARAAPQTDVLFVDTGLHFPETLEMRDEFARRYGLRVINCVPKIGIEEQRRLYGRHLFLHDENDRPGYDECCRIRKEEPFLAVARGRYRAILSGLTQSDGGARRRITIVSKDRRIQGYKINPLARWTEEQIEAYTLEHGIPIHPLYELGYKSIGCRTCTTPVCPGEEKRAGRWRHIHQSQVRPRYCGINLEDRAGI